MKLISKANEPKLAMEAKRDSVSFSLLLCCLCFLLFVFLPIREMRVIRG